jgi:anti-anti-sigma regulatory factor
MMIASPNLLVEQLSEISGAAQGKVFLREITSRMSSNRPRIVLDCSLVREANRFLIHLLLCCLEEAFKRNGDIALAAVPPTVKVMLLSAGAGRLFEIYETTNDAVKHFRQPLDSLHGDVWSAA